MKSVSILKFLFAAALGAALLHSANNLAATMVIQDDVVIEGDVDIEESLTVDGSASVGSSATALGSNSMAIGFMTETGTWGTYSLAVGGETIATGWGNIAVGDLTMTSHTASAAFGNWTLAAGTAAFTAGQGSEATGSQSAAFGRDTLAESVASIAVGRYNTGGAVGGSWQWNEEDPVFEIGIGENDSNRANAMTVYKSGDAEFAGVVRIQPAGDISMGQFTSEP